MQHFHVLFLEQPNNFVLLRCRDAVFLAMSMGEASLLRFVGLRLCNALASEAGSRPRGELVFTIFVVKRLLHVVSADIRIANAHKKDIRYVVHEQEELGLRSRRLRN